jgi:transposase-like protein
VSAVTDSVIDEVTAWQARPLESSYAIVFFDALRVKIRDEGLVKNKAVYLAIGTRPSGHKQVLGLWIEQSEGAKFWLRVMNEIKQRIRRHSPSLPKAERRLHGNLGHRGRRHELHAAEHTPGVHSVQRPGS